MQTSAFPRCGSLYADTGANHTFHVVFTLPREIAAIAHQNKRVVLGILFQAAAETLQTVAADPRHLGARIGFLAVLHTWGSALQFHPHLHCVAPGGGLSPAGGRWIGCPPGFFLPANFQRIRYFGILANRYRKQNLALCAGNCSTCPRPRFLSRPLPTARSRRSGAGRPAVGSACC